MWPPHTSPQPRGNRGAVLGAWGAEGVAVPSPWLSCLGPRSHQSVCVIKLVKVSGMGYLAPLTFRALALSPSTTA